MLLWLISLPVLGCIGISFIPVTHSSKEMLIRMISLATSIVVLLLALVMWWSSGACTFVDTVDSNELQVYTNTYFLTYMPSLFRMGTFFFALDGFSFVFVLLTCYIIPIAILSSWNKVTHRIASHFIALLLLETLLIISFSAQDLLVFYVSFEAILIPLYIIIGVHGTTKDRTRAAILLFMYTLLGSFCMLISIFFITFVTKTTDIHLCSILCSEMSIYYQSFIWAGIFISIAVKNPLVPVHGWLYRAHTESSLAGSILLAGVILKLATYVYVKILLSLVPQACHFYSPIALTIGVFSLIHGSLATFRQIDTKTFIAYSSVGHLAISILGLSSVHMQGIQGSVLLNIAHGLVSPALFILVGGVLYDRYLSRAISYFKGTGSFMPSMKWWFFLASVASMAVPGSLNWTGELLAIVGAFTASTIAGILCCISILVGAIYTIWFYNRITGGTIAPYLTYTNDLTFREWTSLIFFIVPVFGLGLFSSIISSMILLPITSTLIL